MSMLLSVLFVCVALFLGSSVSENPGLPVIPEIYEASITAEIYSASKTLQGQGIEVRYLPGNRALFNVEYADEASNIVSEYTLERGDIQRVFKVNEKGECSVTKTTEKMRPKWLWVYDATYTGRNEFRGNVYDWWNNTVQYQGNFFDMAIAVLPYDFATIPAYLFTTDYTAKTTTIISYDNWSDELSAATFFRLPPNCEVFMAP